MINPDAHSTGGLADLDYGVGVARRGWLGAGRRVQHAGRSKAVAAALEDAAAGGLSRESRRPPRGRPCGGAPAVL